jgi:hypothetical protein
MVNISKFKWMAKPDANLTVFAALQRGADMPLTSLAESMNSHLAVLAADLSSREGRTVKMSEVTA